MGATLTVDDLEHVYATRPVVRRVGFRLDGGRIGCLLGPSGCGKTTVLRCIAGFEPVRRGQIAIDGQVVSRTDLQIPPERRGVGMVFQDFALFPHLTVADNVAFGLARPRSSESRAKVARMLDLVGLAEFSNAYPHALSGGQQQRVALARALAPGPGLLLLDEPFSSLDVDMRERLSTDVRAILAASGTTAILVTHDQHEAFAMADEIGVMREGVIEQWDTPYNLYHRPGNRFVADFVGQGAFLRGVVDADGRIRTELGNLQSALCGTAPDVSMDVLIRPDDIVHDDGSLLRAKVVAKAFRGAQFLYTLALASGTRVMSIVPSHHDHAVGEHIGIRVDIDHVIAFPAEATVSG